MLKEIELVIEEGSVGVTAMGFVNLPAIEIDGYYFNNEKNNLTFSQEIEGEEGLFIAPAMIAEKRIYRFDPYTNEEYNVYFTADTIKKLSMNFMIENQQNNTNVDHETPMKDIHLVYSWIVENDQDQIMTKYGFKDIEVGSWVTMYKINNEEIREKIKSGEINGLSIEGYFTEMFSKSIDLSDKEVLTELRKILKNDKKAD